MAADALIEATGGGGLAGPVTAAVVGVAAAIAFVRVERHRGRSPDREFLARQSRRADRTGVCSLRGCFRDRRGSVTGRLGAPIMYIM
jgi:threonine dehydratase